MRLRLETRHGQIDRPVQLPPGSATLAALARAVLPISDDIAELALRTSATQGRPAVCAPGCAACCRQLVTVSPAEAFLIAEVAGTFPSMMHIEILHHAKLLEPLSRLDDPTLGPATHYALAESYARLDLPCPFLDSASRCAIYSLRPAVCREYLACSPPTHCADPFARPPERLPLAAEVSQALLHLSAQLLRRELHPIPVPLAPAWARAHAREGRRAWDSRKLWERFQLNLEVALNLH